MAYAKLEPSGCGIHKDRVKLRISMYLEPTDPYYDKHYIYIPVFPEDGYPGKLDKEGAPKNQADFDAWEAALPHVWQNTPFHNHFIYPDKDATDADIKGQIEKSFNYFNAFHKVCWDNGKEFIDEWKKVPKRVGDVRCPFVRGDPKDFQASNLKVQDILTRLPEFQIIHKIVPDVDLKIGDRGTIDVGAACTNRSYTQALKTHTSVGKENPANADGSIDTVCLYGATYLAAGNDVWAGTYSAGGNVLTCRDSQSLGTLSVGVNNISGLDITILTGDYIGAHERNNKTSYIELDYSGTGFWTYNGECIDPSDSQTFSWNASRTMSLYGTGTEAAAGWSHDFIGVSNANIGSICGVAIADIGNVNGVS